MTITAKIYPTGPASVAATKGLRSARMFDPEQADEWFAMIRHGMKIGYEPRATLEKMALFAEAIRNNTSDVYLSRETEAEIAAFMAAVRAGF
jgi:hypothetical protein